MELKLTQRATDDLDGALARPLRPACFPLNSRSFPKDPFEKTAGPRSGPLTLAQLGQAAQAVEQYRVALGLEPDNFTARFNLGQLLPLGGSTA